MRLLCQGFSDDLFVSTVDASTSRRLELMDDTKLTEEAKMPVWQEYISASYSPTRHVLRFKANMTSCDVGRNADGTLYIAVRDGNELLGHPVTRVRLHDVGGYLSSLGSPDWVENLLRFAMARDALFVTVYFDAMYQSEENGGIVDGFCSMNLLNALSLAIGTKPLEEIDEDLADILEKQGGLDAVDVYGDDDDDTQNPYCIAVAKTLKTNPEAGGAPSGAVWKPALCNPKATGLWESGRLVRVYQGAKMVLFFIASQHVIATVRV